METYSQSNTIILHFGQDNMSKVIPVFERDQKQAYELPKGSYKGKAMLWKYWKLEPPLNDDQHTKQVLHGNQERNSRGILINLKVHTGKQLKEE
jgi:hypothetical protein